MKTVFLLIAICLLPGVLLAVEIGSLEVDIQRKNTHPFLADHDRVLVVSRDGKALDTYNLYPDPGARVPLHVFEAPEGLIAIDCDGTWLSVDRETGEIRKMGWFWMKPVPESYLGTFRLRKGDRDHSFRKESQITKKQVYLYKDPR